MSKYYAVRVGREIGIFKTWEDCKRQIEGYSGATYKSFSGLEEAKNYLNINLSNINLQSQESLNTIEVYVDGSYNDSIGRYSYGCIILDGKKTKLSGVGDNQKNSSLRNVAGELLGAMEAIKWAYNNNYERIKIFHDYEGISKWATGEWNANKEGTKEYVHFVKGIRDKIQIDFIKVRAHSGNEFNEEADILAKKALDNFIGSDDNSQRLNEVTQVIDYSLFVKVIKSEDSRRNVASFNIKGYVLTEAKLIKVAREFWKKKGNKVKDIDGITIDVNINHSIINWLIIDKNQKQYTFSINLN
ncbi:ribonuclease H family protein [Bacillus sp. RG28]|uniref:ribonuclease H n=1 Tax=Gottfriedia endophytica TaxID=2820819 RepID=A0A940NK34_9BACI|nr:ribonuclease H family protein [Gottfriedia endophytica]MBP0726759.1 ribonuclease H family protein [Gottfriedia endophytica]